MGTSLLPVGLGLAIAKITVKVYFCHYSMGDISQFTRGNGFLVMSQKIMCDGRKIYINILINHFEMNLMLVLISALITQCPFNVLSIMWINEIWEQWGDMFPLNSRSQQTLICNNKKPCNIKTLAGA